jgi:hypothetical protein
MKAPEMVICRKESLHYVTIMELAPKFCEIDCDYCPREPNPERCDSCAEGNCSTCGWQVMALGDL